MDTVATPGSNGKPALGVAIAGGSGKGLISGVQSIYHFFYHRQMRGIDPTPVSRFNMAEALVALRTSGCRLAEMARTPRPFPGEDREERWPDVLAYYTGVAYLEDGPLEEFFMLAQQLLRTVQEHPRLSDARREYDRAERARQSGDLATAARHAVRTYQMLYHAPR
jgi:hypothetical protein